MSAVYEFLSQRQSASILAEPKPSRDELEKILKIGGTVPDHGSLKPYRFIVVQDAAREKFAAALLNAAEEKKGALEDKLQQKIKAKAYAAPLQIAIIYSPVASEKIPDWEQRASAACAGYAVVLGANALGFGAVWKSLAFDPGSLMKSLFQMRDGETLLGWVNVGTEKERQRQQRRELDLQRHALFL